MQLKQEQQRADTILIRSRAKTDDRYGKRLTVRSVEELIGSGFIIVDKPAGPSSHQITETVKNMLGAKKAGHLGTLDPNVSGVLPILLGTAVKAAAFLMAEEKGYVGILQFHNDISEKDIQTVFSHFIGEIEQLPPVRSAVARRLRKRTIHSLDIMEINGRDVLFRTRVEAGTYIRKLASDIGRKSGKGAHLVDLRRISVSTLTESSAITLHSLAESAWLWKEKKEEQELRSSIIPIENAVETLGMKRVWILDSAVDPVCSGAQLMVPGVSAVDQSIKDGDKVVVLSLKDELVAFGQAMTDAERMLLSSKENAVKVLRVMMERGTYPSWQKKSLPNKINQIE